MADITTKGVKFEGIIPTYDGGGVWNYGGSARFSITGDVHVNGSTDFNINGASRRINFTSGSGTVKTTTGNSLILQTNSADGIVIDGSTQNVTIANDLALTGGALSISGDGSNAATFTETSAGILTIATVDDFIVDAVSDIILDAGGADIRFKDGGTEFGRINNNSSGNFLLLSPIADKDIIFKGNDGGSEFVALTLDMSEAGDGTFNRHVKASNVGSGTTIVRPGTDAQWGASGTSTGRVEITLPGTTASNNHGMVYLQIDVYEYSATTGPTTYWVGGHNWNNSWYSSNAYKIGAGSKKIYLGVRNSRYVVLIGDANSSWSYGSVHVSYASNGTFYANNMDMTDGTTSYGSGQWSATLVTHADNAYTNLQSDLATVVDFKDTHIRAERFVDEDATSFYAKPGGTSVLNAATFGGTVTVAGATALNGGLKVVGPASHNTIRSANDYTLGLKDSAGTDQWWFKTYTSGNFAIHENGVGDKFTLAAGGDATFTGTVNAPYIRLSSTANAITITNHGDGNSFLNVNHSGNESWQFKAISGSGSEDWITIGTSGGVVSFGEDGDLITDADASIKGGILYLGTADTSSGHINAKELMTFNIDTDNDDTNRYFAWYTNGESGSGTELLKITETGAATFAGDVSIAGDLNVTGISTTTNVVNLDVSDNIIGLNRGSTSNANDSGIIIERGSTGDNAAFLWDESADRFVFGTTTANPAATGNISFTRAPIDAKGFWTSSSATAHWGPFDGGGTYGTLTWDTGYALVQATGSNTLKLGGHGDANDIILDDTLITISKPTTFTSGKVTTPLRKYCSASISNSYVKIYRVESTSSQLAGTVRISGTSHGTGHVGNFTALVMVNHYQDVLIKSHSSEYTQVTLKVESDNNEDYHLSVKSTSANAATYYFTIEALTSELTITTLPSTTPATNTVHEHTTVFGSNETGEGGTLEHKVGGNATFAGSINTTGDMVLKSDGTSVMTLWDSGGAGYVKIEDALVINAAAATVYDDEGDNFVIYETATPGMTIASGTNGRGTIQFADGTSGNTAYRGTICYDHATGTSGSSVADSMYFRTAGAINMALTGAGNLGVGTMAPSRPLSVYRSSAGSVANFLHYTDASNFAGLYIDVSHTSNLVTLNASGDSGATWEFQSGNNTCLTMDSAGATFSGRVGLNGTTPTDFNADADDLIVGGGSGDTGITIYSGANVGNYGAIYFADGTSGVAEYRGIISYEQNNEIMRFHTNTTEALKLDSSQNATFAGDVNLNSTATNKPVLNLTSTNGDANGPVINLIKDSASPAANDDVGRIYMRGENSASGQMEAVMIRGQIVDPSNTSFDSKLTIYTYKNNAQDPTLILESGKVGIGGAPTNKFSIKDGSNANFEAGCNSDSIFIQSYNRTTSAWADIVFNTNGESLRIDSSKNATFAGDVTINGGDLIVNPSSSNHNSTIQIKGYEPYFQLRKTRGTNGDDYFKIKHENDASAVDFTLAQNGGSDTRIMRITSNNRLVVGGHTEYNSSTLTVDGTFGVSTTSKFGGAAIFEGNLTALKLTSTGGVLDLDDNGDADGVINARASLTLNIDSDANSTGEVFRINSNTTGVNTNNLFNITETGTATFAGAGTFETTLNVSATDGGGSPAMTSIINMHGYDGRGVGIKMKDNVTTSSGGDDNEWFVGTGYNQSGFNIGYASDGSQSSYSAQAKLQIATNGDATFAGNVSVSGWIKGASDTNTLYSSTSLGTYLQSPTNSGTGGHIYFRNNSGTVFQTFSQVDGSATFTGTVVASNLSGTNTGDQTLPTASSLGAVTLTGAQTISGNKNFTGNGNVLNGHLYYSPYDSAGNHYPHFNDGASASGTTINWRQYYGSSLKTHTWASDSSGNMLFTYQGGITAVGIVTATGGNSTNWNTAYGWGNHASAGYITSTGSALNLNAIDDRDMAPEDRSYSDDLRIFFSSREGLEDGSSSASDWQDVLFLNSYSDSSGGNANILAFDKNSYIIRHYQAGLAATNWGTAKTLAYLESPTFTGTVKIPSKLEHDGDTNTYFSFSANDHIELTAGGTEFLAIDGTNFNVTPSGNFNIDAGGDINLDADGGDINFKDGGTTVGALDLTGGFAIKSSVSNADFFIQGNDGGSIINALQLDMSDAGKATFNNDVVAFSDERLKKNIETLDGSKVYDMRGVSFTRKDTGKDGSGVIAQEIQKIAPELVTETNGTLGVAYGNLTGYLIEAIKDLKVEVEELKKQIK